MHTYAASAGQTFWKLRLPASLPFLFPSLRVGIAAGLVGAIVAELPTGAQAGLGARLLTGSYYGNTVQIWSALVMSALLGLALTGAVAWAERLVLRRRRPQVTHAAGAAQPGGRVGALRCRWARPWPGSPGAGPFFALLFVLAVLAAAIAAPRGGPAAQEPAAAPGHAAAVRRCGCWCSGNC